MLGIVSPRTLLRLCKRTFPTFRVRLPGLLPPGTRWAAPTPDRHAPDATAAECCGDARARRGTSGAQWDHYPPSFILPSASAGGPSIRAAFDAPVAHLRSACPDVRRGEAASPERRTPPHRGAGDLCASGARGRGAIGSRLRKCWPRLVGALARASAFADDEVPLRRTKAS